VNAILLRACTRRRRRGVGRTIQAAQAEMMEKLGQAQPMGAWRSRKSCEAWRVAVFGRGSFVTGRRFIRWNGGYMNLRG